MVCEQSRIEHRKFETVELVGIDCALSLTLWVSLFQKEQEHDSDKATVGKKIEQQPVVEIKFVESGEAKEKARKKKQRQSLVEPTHPVLQFDVAGTEREVEPVLAIDQKHGTEKSQLDDSSV